MYLAFGLVALWSVLVTIDSLADNTLKVSEGQRLADERYRICFEAQMELSRAAEERDAYRRFDSDECDNALGQYGLKK